MCGQPSPKFLHSARLRQAQNWTMEADKTDTEGTARLTTPVTDVTRGAACHHRNGRDLRHAAM